MADEVVIAAALVAQLEDGGERYFYQGETLSGVGDDEVKRLTEIGLIGEPKEIPDATDPVTAPRSSRTARSEGEAAQPVKRTPPKSG